VNKQALVHLHALMIHFKNFYEETTNDEIHTDLYDSLEISPIHLHRYKQAHREALLTLGAEIVIHLHNLKQPEANTNAPQQVIEEQ